MLFSKNDDGAGERTLYKTKPNVVLGCKKAIYAAILLGVVLFVSPMAIQFIGEMQVYLISQITLPLTRYTAIGIFVIMLVLVIYIIWQLVGWYATEYVLTDTRVIIKTGVLYSRKNYMPYSKVQDINTSQSILARLFNVGSISIFSAYDNNNMTLKNISNPTEVETIIFENMVSPRSFQHQSRGVFARGPQQFEREEYYDEYEPITPINREKDLYPRREYDYYPEDAAFNTQNPKYNNYEYEPYMDDVDYNIDRAMNNINSRRSGSSEDSYYNEVRSQYSYRDDDYYSDNESEIYYNDPDPETYEPAQGDVDNSSETVIRRHFDKFKR